MKLTNTEQQFILHWGEMGNKWGVNRTIAQIHALLYITKNPLTAEDIAKILQIARSNVSNSIKELLSWKLIKKVTILTDRKDYFTTSSDVWELAKLITQGRIQRELEPTLEFLTSLVNTEEIQNENQTTRERLKQTEEFIQIITTWVNEMLKQEPKTIMRILKYGMKLIHLKKSITGNYNKKNN